jgi:integrase
MFSLEPQRARIGIKPYRDRTRPHLKWTIAGYYVNGKRVRRFFEKKTEAETFAQQIQVKAENLGSRALGIDPKLHVMAIESHDLLAPYGKTIADAARFYHDHLETVNRSCTVDELVTGFLQNKEDDGKSSEYLRDLRSRLGRFRKAFGALTVATITARECDDWLRAIRLSPLSRNNYRRVLNTLFAHAVARGYAPGNPIPKTSKAKTIAKPVEVLTPEETRRLLESADADVLPSLAIGAFAGLRPAEISRLDWKEVHLDRGFIEVSASKSKTASRRLVTIQPNLKAWLEPLSKLSGPVEPPNFRKKIDAARVRAGIEDWPANALRHSFASYHLAQWQDAPALALQLGHTTTAMLYTYYREVVTPKEAEAYWSSLPAA